MLLFWLFHLSGYLSLGCHVLFHKFQLLLEIVLRFKEFVNSALPYLFQLKKLISCKKIVRSGKNSLVITGTLTHFKVGLAHHIIG